MIFRSHVLIRALLLSAITALVIFIYNKDHKIHKNNYIYKKEQDIFSYIIKERGTFDQKLYLELLGYASEFKEGDVAIGLGTNDQALRRKARELLRNTSLKSLDEHPIVDGQLQKALRANVDLNVFASIAQLTFGELKDRLLSANEREAKLLCTGLSSDAMASLIKLMSNDELILLGQKIYHALPGSSIGAPGYLSARLQPNSPTDDPEDILMSVLSVWSYAEGDLMLGTNPVSSEKSSVLATELVLKDLVETFKLEKHLPWTVLAHVDIQAEIEKEQPGSTALWFQSIAGTDAGLKTFGVPLENLMLHAQNRSGPFAFYMEAGQGGDFTNGHGLADMLSLESYKDGLFLLLNRDIEARTGKKVWSVINDVAGFIGPEVFKNKDQLLRTMLEDLALGKMHGLTYGLDVCATLHMDVDVDDLREVYLKVMEARPAYTMVLPYMNDPMLSYLTTGVHQLVKARLRYGFKRSEDMEAFFKRVGVLKPDGTPNPEHFGDPLHMYWRYRLAKNDQRPKELIMAEGEAILSRVAERGVVIARGYGKDFGDLPAKLEEELKGLVHDAKRCLRSRLPKEFIASLNKSLQLSTLSCTAEGNDYHACDRERFINRPDSGEKLNEHSLNALLSLKAQRKHDINVQIIVSDGLNANALSDEGHALPYLKSVRERLVASGFKVADETLVLHNGRVRAGYHIGQVLFGESIDQKKRIIINVIGERPGTAHHNFSVYITAPSGSVWASNDAATAVDHNITRVISGISDSALNPLVAAEETVSIVQDMIKTEI